MACREEEIPNTGDYHIYDVVGKSFIVTRTADGTIKAFYNSCLHRGRKLVTLNGCKERIPLPLSRHGVEHRRFVQGQPDRVGFPAMERTAI
jgi:nitrite reductase/ring-hydroxylating ferredoxin subunit